MKILKTLIRVCVNDSDTAIRFYESLTGLPVARRIRMPSQGLELAQVGDILIIAGIEDALRPFRRTNATFLVDSLEDYQQFLAANGAEVLRPLQQVPTGINMTVRHPDGSVIECVEHRNG